jgi:non-heme chloroperoxidase
MQRRRVAIVEAMRVNDKFGVDRSRLMPKFDRPTLVIASASSQELEEQESMASALPEGHFELIEDAGHAVFLDQPEQFDRLLRTFLPQTDMGPGT